MKKLLLILFLIPRIASAQVIHTTNELVSDFNDRLYEGDCLIPIAPNAPVPEQVIEVKVGYKIAFCVEEDGVKAATFQYSMMVDQGETLNLQVACTKTSLSSLCISLIPSPAITILQLKTDHIIAVMAKNPTATMGVTLTFKIRRPICVIDGITYEKGQPLPASIPGMLRNQQGSFTFETQVGKLRDAGAIVEWQRLQFGKDSDGLNGYWIMLGWCKGK